MIVLVTGGTGFLGQHTARRLLAQGHQVYLLGRDFATATDLLTQGAVPVVADLRTAAAVSAACAGVDAVIHAGALSAAWGQPAAFHAINVGGTEAVIAACQQHGVSRLVYVSSPSVIFDGRSHVNATEEAPFPRRFQSVYALTKKLGEDRVRAAAQEGLPTVIIRPKAIFGPGDRSLLPNLIAVARRGRLPQIGHGHNLVDLTYVENVAHALTLALQAPTAIGRTYHITNDEHLLLWDVIRYVLSRLGLRLRRRSLPLPLVRLAATLMETQARFSGRDPLLTRYTAGILACTQTYDIRAARQDLGYRPLVSVAAGIEETLRHM